MRKVTGNIAQETLNSAEAGGGCGIKDLKGWSLVPKAAK